MIEYLQDLDRAVLVGPNSQGKTYLLEQLMKDKDFKGSTVAVWSEIKADENLKNTTDSTTLITWLNKLIEIDDLKEMLDEKIKLLDFSNINDNSNIKVELTNELKSYKGLLGVDIKTSSNQWESPGAGERFLGTLNIISKILEENTDNSYKYLIIDEPERHLHPSLYMKTASILNKISKQNIKVIISTHSPRIVKYFVEDTNEIIKLDNGEIFQLPNKEELFKSYLEFNLYLDNDLKYGSFKKIETNLKEYFDVFILPMIYDSLFSKYTIIAEGYAEKEIFELFVEKYKHDDILTNLNFLIVHGKCFMPWIIKSLKLTESKIISLYDVDDITKPKNKNLNEIITSLSEDVIEISEEIEKYLKLEIEDRRDKVKTITVAIRSLYLKNDQKLLKLIELIHDTVKKTIN